MSEMKLTSLAASEGECAGCGSCPSRREFFRVGVGAAVVAAIAAVLPASAAGATPIRWVRSVGSGGALRYPVPTADGVDVDRDHEVILVRYQGTVAAFALSCPHQRSMLRWREGDGIFQCTKHHSEYSPTGVYLKGRATRNMDRLGISLDGSEVVIDPDTVYHSDEDPTGWASAVVQAP
jgi:Rieske Fe-S protein